MISQKPVFNILRHIFVCLLLFIGTYLIYKSVYSQPRNWYDHYMYLSRALIGLKADVSNLPDYFQDKVVIGGRTFLPFGPLPGVILIPFILLSKSVTQQEVSVLFGSLNIFLSYLLLKKFTKGLNAILISVFLAFGTVYFWAAIVGTTWYFAHIIAVTFLLLSLLAYFEKKDFLAGILFALAGLARYPIMFGGLFFLFELMHERRRLFNFLAGAFIFIPLQLGYDWIRFGSLFETGYVQVYQNYIHSNYPYTIMQLFNSHAPYFGYLDIRNIPLHLFTFFVFPPVITQNLSISPSPYGTGIIFTTPLLLLALWPNWKDRLERNLFIGGASIALIDFLHYMQGWVQFGYRFLLDFLPFFLIILAIRFKLKRNYLVLLGVSLAINYWGVTQAIKLGW